MIPIDLLLLENQSVPSPSVRRFFCRGSGIKVILCVWLVRRPQICHKVGVHALLCINAEQSVKYVRGTIMGTIQ